MNPNTPRILKSYMFQTGNIHPAVKIVKSFLNSSPKVNTANLKGDITFDAGTKAALAEFQKNKNLNPTGRMDIGTWLAIGSEMDPITINVVSIGHSFVRDLLSLGYRSQFPKVRNTSFINEPVKIVSARLETPPDDYRFTFRIFVTIFAPFNWFGPSNLSRGDKSTRHFGTDLSASYRLRAESKLTAAPGQHYYSWSLTKAADATTSYLDLRYLKWWKALTGELETAKSEGFIDDEDTGENKTELHREGNTIRYHFYGNDDAFALIGDDSYVTSDIDVHPDITFKWEPMANSKQILMKAFCNIVGDKFPAVECYIVDRNNTGVMLGVFQIQQGDGPITLADGSRGIIGDKRLPMINTETQVIVENGLFSGIRKNGIVISPAQHNKVFTDLPPVNPAVRIPGPNLNLPPAFIMPKSK